MNRIVFSALCASLGGALLSAFLLSLAAPFLHEAEETPVQNARALEFPTNAEMLDNLARQLEQEQKALSAIAPAAGP